MVTQRIPHSLPKVPDTNRTFWVRRQVFVSDDSGLPRMLAILERKYGADRFTVMRDKSRPGGWEIIFGAESPEARRSLAFRDASWQLIDRADPERPATDENVAEILGVDDRSVRRWRSRYGLPRQR
jgi:hypothetical protein